MGKCNECNHCPKVSHHKNSCGKQECEKRKKKVEKCFKCEIPCSENKKVEMLEVKHACGCNNHFIYVAKTFDPLKMARKCYVPVPVKTEYCCEFRHDIDSCTCEESECPIMLKVVSGESCHKKSKKHHHHKKGCCGK
jgi:hypothetical protein